MMHRTVSPRSMVITVLSFLGVSLAILWPNWRGEIKALGEYPVIVVLNGQLTVVESGSELSLRLAAQVSSGKTPVSNILQGNGSTSVLHDRGKPSASATHFDLTGLLTADGWVILQGKVVKSNDPLLVGETVSITANEQTGHIYMMFCGLILEGDGKVVIR